MLHKKLFKPFLIAILNCLFKNNISPSFLFLETFKICLKSAKKIKLKWLKTVKNNYY